MIRPTRNSNKDLGGNTPDSDSDPDPDFKPPTPDHDPDSDFDPNPDHDPHPNPSNQQCIPSEPPQNTQRAPPTWMKRAGYEETGKMGQKGPLYRPPQKCGRCERLGRECLVYSLRTYVRNSIFHSSPCTSCTQNGRKCDLVSNDFVWRWDHVDGTFVQEAVPQPLLSDRERKRRRRTRAKGGQPVARRKQNVSDKRNTVLTRQATKDEDDRDDERDVDGGVLAPSTSSNDATAFDLQAPDVIEVLDSDDENVNTNTPVMRTTGFKRPQSRGGSAGPSSSKRPRNDFPFPNPFNVSTPAVSSAMTVHCPPASTATPSRGGGPPIKAEEGGNGIVQPTHLSPASTAIPSRGALSSIKAEEQTNRVIKVEEERNGMIVRPQRGGIQTPTRTATPTPASTLHASGSIHAGAFASDIDLGEKVVQLEAELKSTKAKLESTTAKLESTTVKLKATREECDDVTEERDNLLEMYRNSLRKGKGRRLMED